MCGFYEITKTDLCWRDGFQSQPPDLDLEEEPEYKTIVIKFEGPGKHDKSNCECEIRQI